MAPSPLALVQDLADWLGEPIVESVDTTRASSVLAAASALVRAYADQAWSDPATVPDEVRIVTIQAAARGYSNPEGWRDERVDDWSGMGRPVQEAGLYLTASERAILAKHRPARVSGIGTLATTKVTTGPALDGFVPTDGGPPFPWY